MFWIIWSIIGFTTNLPEMIENFFVVDFTQCYENIPIESKDNFIFAMSFFVTNIFQQYHSHHPRS
jgi:hypothetical protein